MVLYELGAMPSLVIVFVVGGLMFLDASPVVGLLLPGDLMVVTVVASNSAAESVLAVIGAVVGTMISWSVFFYVGRAIGPRLRAGRFGAWVGRRRWETAEQMLAGRGARALTVVQFLPVLNSIVPMVAGGLGMPYRQFFRYAATGTTAWAVFFGGVGVWSGFASNIVFGESRSLLELLLFSAPGFVAAWIMVVILRRELAAHRATAAAAATPAAGTVTPAAGTAEGTVV